MKSAKPGYRIFEFDEETSRYDPQGKWRPGTECYFVEYRVWVPIVLGSDSDKIMDWISNQMDIPPDERKLEVCLTD